MCAMVGMWRSEDNMGVGGLSLSVMWVQESNSGCKAQWQASLTSELCLLF